VRWEPRTRWGAWLSYSFAESKDVFAGFSAPRTWDQRHSLASGGSWTSHPWQLSATVNWHSGWRRNELSQSGGNGSPLVTLLPRNASAWDPFLSIDLRASWSRSLRHGVLRLYADLSNATNHANLCCSAYQLRPGNPLERSDSTLAPRYILAGANWAWP
jgi:hypothetical protein